MTRSTSKPTLVMGAGGSVGRHVLAGLIARGVPVRASARKPVPSRFPDDVPVVTADLTEPESLAAAFRGAGQVFLYANHPGVQGVIEQARRAGIEKVVLMSSGSVIHPPSAGNAITEEHSAVEEAFASATDLTILPIRPLVLATNALSWSHPIKAGAGLSLYAPDAATAPIHELDVAAVAVEALTGAEGHAVSALLTGPVRLTQREQVAVIAEATGREVVVRELDRSAALEQFMRFMPQAEARAVVQFLDGAADGNSPATSAVADIVGRPATSFQQWAADHAADFI